MNAVFAELAAEPSSLRFLQLDAYKFSSVADRLNVMSVPVFVFLRDGKPVDSLDGADVALLVDKTREHALRAAASMPAQPGPTQDEQVRSLTRRAPVMLFMKGSPDQPSCGFSRTICELLRSEKVIFDSFDVLENEEVRQRLKVFSNWPTYPQLYADGKLLGGLDIVQELHEQGELCDALPTKALM